MISEKGRETIGGKYDKRNRYQKLNYQTEVLFINSCQLVTPRSFSLS